MARLPTVGGDDGNWGTVLNDFLSQAHNSDGTIKSSQQVYNVKDYGAKGDNSNDDTSAITSAINAASSATYGGVVYFPPGNYRTTGGHTIPNNVSIIGAGKGITTISHRGSNTYLFNLGPSTGQSPPNQLPRVGYFSILGLSGQSTGGQIGIQVVNCQFFNLEDIHATVIWKAFLFDGGTPSSSSIFAGIGRVSNLTASNVYYGFYITNWVTSTTFQHLYAFGNSPIRNGATGLLIEGNSATCSFMHPMVEGFDIGFSIGTLGTSGQDWISPRVENCNTEVSWLNNSEGHVIIGGDKTDLWATGTNVGRNAQIQSTGYFPIVTSLPTASASNRHLILKTEAGVGVRDTLNVVYKDSDESYAWRDLLASNSSGTGLLSSKQYNPASKTPLSSAISNTSFQDIDSTNLAITFTAPASGKVLVRLCGLVSRNGTSAVYWGLADSNGYLTGSGGQVVSTQGNFIQISYAVIMTGLTSGQSYTWKWVHRPSVNSASDQAVLRVGGDPTVDGYAPAIMEIWSA